MSDICGDQRLFWRPCRGAQVCVALNRWLRALRLPPANLICAPLARKAAAEEGQLTTRLHVRRLNSAQLV